MKDRLISVSFSHSPVIWPPWVYKLSKGAVFGRRKDTLILELIELGGRGLLELRCGLRFEGGEDKPNCEPTLQVLKSIKHELLRDRVDATALFPTDWIEIGGNLYCPPFCSQALLYQLFDQGCTVLIYHRPLSSVTGSQVLIKEQTAIFVHVAPSPDMSVPELLKTVPLSMDVKATDQEDWTVGGVRVRIEKGKMLARGMIYQCVHTKARPYEFPISGTDYFVRGRASLKKIGNDFPEGDFDCWKVFVGCATTGTTYDLSCELHWTLHAFELDQDGSKKSGVSLLRSNRR
jgi:hypothetical protein